MDKAYINAYSMAAIFKFKFEFVNIVYNIIYFY